MKDLVVFDLDGTLANVQHRLHYIDGSFAGYHRYNAACIDDTLYSDIAEIAKGLNQQGYALWVVTARPIEMQAVTVHWFREYLLHPDRLLMRPVGNTLRSAELKCGWLQDGTIPKDRVLCVFEDRDADVAMWRTAGLTCFQVRPQEEEAGESLVSPQETHLPLGEP